MGEKVHASIIAHTCNGMRQNRASYIPAKTESGECEASEGGEEVPGGE